MIDFPNEDAKWAWLAGIVEGEGCLNLAISKRKTGKWWYKAQFVISNNSLEILENVQQVVENGQIYKAKIRGNRIQSYQFFINSRSRMLEVLHFLMPFLITKKRQAQLIIEFQNLTQHYKGKSSRAHEIYLEMRKLNQKYRRISSKSFSKKCIGSSPFQPKTDLTSDA